MEVDEDLRAREDARLVLARELGLLQAPDDRDVEVLPDLRDEADDALAARPVRAVDLQVVALRRAVGATRRSRRRFVGRFAPMNEMSAA